MDPVIERVKMHVQLIREQIAQQRAQAQECMRIVARLEAEAADWESRMMGRQTNEGHE